MFLSSSLTISLNSSLAPCISGLRISGGRRLEILEMFDESNMFNTSADSLPSSGSVWQRIQRIWPVRGLSHETEMELEEIETTLSQRLCLKCGDFSRML